MLMVGSFCVSCLEGLIVGGSFSTLLDGVTPLLTVSAALLPTVLSVGASSFTLASKRSSTRGLEPAFQLAATQSLANVASNEWLASSHCTL